VRSLRRHLSLEYVAIAVTSREIRRRALLSVATSTEELSHSSVSCDALSLSCSSSIALRIRFTCISGKIAAFHLSCSAVPSYPILSYPILSHLIKSNPTLFNPILSYSILSYPILSYPILSYPILSYLILLNLIPSYSNKSHPISTHPIPSHPILV
jgi:hypothetical protein